MSEALRPSDRVRRASEFRAASRQGARVHTRSFLWLVDPDPALARARLGITVGKTVSQRAVDRNRIKRLVRDVFRRHRDLFPVARVVCIAKADALGLSHAALLDEVGGAAPRLARALRRGREAK